LVKPTGGSPDGAQWSLPQALNQTLSTGRESNGRWETCTENAVKAALEVMNCSEFEAQISDYVDGLQASSDATIFREHLLQCRPCRALLNEIKGAIDDCKSTAEMETTAPLQSLLLDIPAIHAALDCAGFQDLITEFLDGFVPASVYHRFEEHAAQCSACSELLTGVVYAVAAAHSVHTYEEIELPSGLVDSLVEIAAQRKPGLRVRAAARIRLIAARMIPRATPRRRWTFATGAALAVATFMLLLFGFSDDGSVAGIYRKANLKVAELYSDGADVYAEKDRMAARIEKVGLGIGELWDTLGGDDAHKTRVRPSENQESQPAPQQN
jgi:predicted anti-sigma-YlaC factor YlaD